MSRLRRLDDELLSGALWTRTSLRVALFLLLGFGLGAVAGGLAWPLVSLSYSPSDYSVVAVPFITVPLGAVVGVVLTGVLLVRRHTR